MEQYYDIIKTSQLFKGIGPENYPVLLGCLNGTIKQFDKNETVFMAGNPATKIALVLSGAVHVVRDDAFGVRTILTNCEAGDLFGESFSLAEISSLPISAIAAQPSTLLLLSTTHIIHSCSLSCDFHRVLIDNMVRIIAHKNINLNQKNEILSSKTIRNKLLTYFSILSSQVNDNKIQVPFDRQGLADYLSVDRSAMSTELGKMRDEGILVFQKNNFELLQRFAL